MDALRELPEVKADLDHWESAGSGDHGYDAQVDLHVAGKSYVLLVEAKQAVFPRDVRQVLWQFREASLGRSAKQGQEPLSLLVAESTCIRIVSSAVGRLPNLSDGQLLRLLSITANLRREVGRTVAMHA